MKEAQMQIMRNHKTITVDLELDYVPAKGPTWDCAGEPEEYRARAYDWSRFFPLEVQLHPSEQDDALKILLDKEFVMVLTDER